MSCSPVLAPCLAALLALSLPLCAAEPSPSFRAITIDADVAIGYGLAIADVDGDGRPDILLADKTAFAWYHNPDWQKHILAEHLTEQDNVCVAAADIDGDGKAEIAVGAGWNPGDTIGSGALFYLRAPADRTQRWEAIRLAHDPTIHRIRWARNREGQFDLVSVPLHGRGNRGGVGDGVRILAYHRPVDPTAAWTTTVISDRWHATHNFEPCHFGDQKADELLVAAKEGVFHLVPLTDAWRVETLATNGPATPGFLGAGEVRVGRVAGRLAFVSAIEPMHGNQLTIYSPRRADEGPGVWRRKVIDETLVDGHALACADLLGLGRDQIVAGWRAMNRPGVKVGIRLYVPDPGDPLGEWQTRMLDDNQMACEDLQVADLDGDGDLDVVASGRATHNLKIYFNERLRSP